ncbi:MAG: glycosyltransferase [Chloroflexota bacterium]|nr:glycosyltransferase [Chloroflexota bacterium]MDQ5865297.1 glycosyltransferase [Chloroflexota bacterium]
MKTKGLQLDELRALIINGITASVALGLTANVLRNREIEPRPWQEGTPAPLIEIIVPARNEEANIRPLLQTLLRQKYPHDRYRITVVDDNSTDATATLAREMAARYTYLRVMETPPLPAGWTGKNHALWTAARQAVGADWLLFVDADTRHHPLMLPTVVQHANRVKTDLLSLVTEIRLESFWDRLVVPQVGELYTLLVGSMDAVNGKGQSAAANGQFILVRPQLYQQVGATEAVRSDVAEDRALAAACKAAGATIRLDYGRRLVSTNVYDSFGSMWRGYSKTLFWATGIDTRRALLVSVSLTFYAFAPIVHLIRTIAAREARQRHKRLRNASLQLLPMMLLRAAVCRQMGVPLRYAPTYPLSVALGNAMLLYSLFRVLSGRGVGWKGRTYRK